jgi:CRP-like cAMP-binding protein
MASSVTAELRRVPLLAGLTELELADLAGASRVDPYAREQIIFRQGDPCDRFWLLANGQVKIIYQTEDGHRPSHDRGRNG